MTHPARDDLALAALPAEPRNPAVEEHLVECPHCREHVDGLRWTVELARVGGVEEGPPLRVWEAIAAEIGGQAALPPATQRDRIQQDRMQRGPAHREPSRRGPSRWLVPAAAAAAGLVVGVAGSLGVVAARETPAPSQPVVVAQLAPVGDADPGSSGTVAMRSGERGELMLVDLTGVVDLRGGDFLEAWLMDPAGKQLLALGTLARDGSAWHGVFTVPAGQPAAPFTVVDISAETFAGGPDHSQVSLLRGRLA